MLPRDFFNREEKVHVKVYAHHNDVERYRKKANTDQKEQNHPEIVHEALSEGEIHETWLLNHYSLAVNTHAHIASMIEELDCPGCWYPLVLFANMSYERVPMDSTFLWKMARHRPGLLGQET